MTLRRRLTLLAAASVALAICLASVVVYVAVRSELRAQTDDGLRAQAAVAREQASQIGPAPGPGSIPEDVLVPPEGPAPFGAPGPIFLQRLGTNGLPEHTPPPGAAIPVEGAAREVAASGEGEELSDAEVGDQHVRVITVGLGDGGALQIARSLEGTDAVLSNLRVVLVLVILGGIGLAALLARRIADRMIAPITGLTEAAEHITETEDLSRRIEVGSEDEVGRLAERFNSMLGTLEASRAELADSVQAQRQLVADASHELRTPVASLRTDIEVLRENAELPEAERRRVLAALDARTEELGALITDVIELARGDEVEATTSEVRLDRLVAEAVERTRGHVPGRRFELDLDRSVVEGRPDRLGRAVNNLLDNAVKYSPDATPIEVSVAAGTVVVRDHGPGIDAAELPRVFDRFQRGAGVRDVPGSGLGLAIVKQVAEAHGGSVEAANAGGGGAVFALRLPAGPSEA
jgi:two-component system sensor histidine kinase MprB